VSDVESDERTGDGCAHIRRSLEEWREPGAAELCERLEEMVRDTESSEQTIRLERLKRAVYRLRIGSGPGRTLVLKRHKPAIAQTDRLLAERWLPALGLGDRCPRLLAAAAEREGCSVWHMYEDLGDESLAAERLPWRLAAAVDFIAELHTRAAGHTVLPEVRWRARDHGVHFFASNLHDAIAALETLASPDRQVPHELIVARTRLLHRLSALLEDFPRRTRIVDEVGGPTTLLHGDLWPKNVFVTIASDRPQTRLIDWDHVGVGSFSYDVSTFLYQSSPEERPEVLRRYREAVERAGWRLPENRELNLLFHTAESARYVQRILWAAMALVNDGAEWGMRELVDYERWFEALRPPLEE
jgi:thiamine kinase-like enzyme